MNRVNHDGRAAIQGLVNGGANGANGAHMTSLGIDFGTTNSAIAIARRGEPAALVPLPGPGGGTTPTWRTVLYFEPADDDRGPPRVSAGPEAIARYEVTEGQGRFIQSMKSHLASEHFSATHVFGVRYAVEDLVARYLDALLRAAGLRGAAGVERLVVGRPVRYWGASDEADDRRAIERMRRALAAIGFDQVEFEYEPVAAAYRYAAGLAHRELLLVADFGGGTSDFSLIEVGGPEAPVVRATDGVAVSGDAFDGRLIDAVVAPKLGKGTSYDAGFGREMPVPPWLFARLRRWHHLSFLKSPETTALLDKIEAGAADPARIVALRRVVEDDLGLPLHRSVETAKIALSGAPRAPFAFDRPEVAFGEEVARAGFEAWIAEDLAAIGASIDRALAKAGVGAADVDRVFATGGTAFVPAVRALLAGRFGEGKLAGGDELTSVAWGLGARAQALG